MKDLRHEAGRFDRRAHRYDRWLKQWWFFRPVHRTMLATLDLRRGERFLEVGSGTGNLTHAAVARTGVGVGVDPAAKMVAVAREKHVPTGAHAAFVVGAAEALPVPTAAFDVAATSISMHHWVDPHAGLTEIRRALVPGGRLVVADVAPRGFGTLLAGPIGLLKRGHADVWEADELARAVQRAGFRRVRLLRSGWISHLAAFVAAEAPD